MVDQIITGAASVLWGPAGDLNWMIGRNSDEGGILLASSNAGNVGGNILMYAENHASFAGDVRLRSGTTSFLFWDQSATLLTLTGAVTVAGAFTSIGIDDNATGERLQIEDTILQVGSTVAANTYEIAKQVNDGVQIYSGGIDSTDGLSIYTYGANHASRPGDLRMRSSNNTFLEWDESAGSLTLSAGVGAKTAALTLSSTGFASFQESISILEGKAYYMDGGSNTFIYSPTSDVIDIVTNGASALTIAATGAATFASAVTSANLFLPDNGILAWGDLNTYIQGNGTNDTLVLVTDGTAALSISSTQNATFAQDVYVGGGSSVSYTSLDQLVIGQASGSHGVVVESGATNTSRYAFGDASLKGSMEFDHTNGKLIFNTGDNLQCLEFDSSANALFDGALSCGATLTQNYIDPIHHILDAQSGRTAILQTNGGLKLESGGMNTTNKYTPHIGFGSQDDQITDKGSLAYIVGEAAQTMSDTAKAGMGIAFFTNPVNVGHAPELALKLFENQWAEFYSDVAVVGDIDVGGNLVQSNAAPGYFMGETDAALDQKQWSQIVNGEKFTGRITDDAFGNFYDWLVIERSGTGAGVQVDTIDFTAANTISLGNFVFQADQTVGAGQDNYVLTYDDGTGEISLEVAAGGSGGSPWTYTLQTGTSYTAVAGDFVVASNTGTVTITLPSGHSVDDTIIVKKTGSGGTVTVDGNASETIDGATTFDLTAQYASVTLISDGTNWLIV
jgi:hypothetical protein